MEWMFPTREKNKERERERQRQSGVSRVAGVCRLCTAAQRQAKEKRGRWWMRVPSAPSLLWKDLSAKLMTNEQATLIPFSFLSPRFFPTYFYSSFYLIFFYLIIRFRSALAIVLFRFFWSCLINFLRFPFFSIWFGLVWSLYFDCGHVFLIRIKHETFLPLLLLNFIQVHTLILSWHKFIDRKRC